MTTTSHIGLTLLEQSQAQKEITVNQALVRIDALLNGGAMSRLVGTPPASPSSGDLYIIPAGATGAWAGQTGKLAYFDQLWRFVPAREGLSLWVNDEDILYTYNGTGWLAQSGPAPGCIDVRSYGAAPDCRRAADFVTAAGSPTVTSASAAFSAADTGKVITIHDHATDRYVARGIISAVASATSITISVNSAYTASGCVGYIGSDNAAAITSAITAASALLSSDTAGAGQPMGGGHVCVLLPGDGRGDRYLTNSQISLPARVTLSGGAMLVAAVGGATGNTAGQAGRMFALDCDAGAGIKNLTIECCGGMGVRFAAGPEGSDIHGMTLWNVGDNYNVALSPPNQKGLEIAANDSVLRGVSVRGGNIGIHITGANRLSLAQVACTGSVRGMMLSDCGNIDVEAQFDSCSFVAASVDNCHGVRLRGRAYTDGSTALACALAVGQIDTTNASTAVDAEMVCLRSGGDALRIATLADSVIRVLASNQPISGGGGVAITTGAVFGGGLSGSLSVDLRLDGGITPAGGTLYGNIHNGGQPLRAALTDASGISWNLVAAPFAEVTLAGNRTLANPASLMPGRYILVVKQDATGSRTLGYGTAFKWASGAAPTLSTAANAIDLLTFICDGAAMYGTIQKGMA